MTVLVLLILMFLGALLGLVESGLRPRTMRLILTGQALLVILGCVAFIARLASHDPYYGHDGPTYWEWGGLDPGHVGTYAYVGVSAVAVIVLMATAWPVSADPPRRFSRVQVASAIVPFVGFAAMIGAFSGH